LDDNLVANRGVRRELYAADLEGAHNGGQAAIVADVEGLDSQREARQPKEAHQRDRTLSGSPS
jgi:hypothetical protein